MIKKTNKQTNYWAAAHNGVFAADTPVSSAGWQQGEQTEAGVGTDLCIGTSPHQYYPPTALLF